MELLGIIETVSRGFCTSTQCTVDVVGLIDEYIKYCTKNTTTINIIITLTACTEYCLLGCDTVSFGIAACRPVDK
jgi:hypothetical protein